MVTHRGQVPEPAPELYFDPTDAADPVVGALFHLAEALGAAVVGERGERYADPR